MPWLYLIAAIIFEVVATLVLKEADGFSRPVPSVLVVVGYGVSFFCLSLSLRFFPIAVVYAVWSGAGVALITLAGWLLYKQHLDPAAFAGIGLIIAGVLVLNLFSRSVVH